MPTDTHPLLRSSRRRTLGALLSPTLVAATSCATDTGFGPDATPARIRYVNAVFVAGNPSDTAAGLSGPQFRTTTAVPIDVLVDLSTSAPSRLALAPNSVSSGTSVAAGAAGYADVPAGVRSFVARLASAVDPGTPPRIRTTSFYTNPVDSLPYLPRQTLTPGTPYTLVVAGQLPAPVVTATAPPPRTPAAAVPFVLLPDDPFTPPSAGGVLQARFRVINAAPYVTGTSAATGATLAVYLTPRGAAAPAGATLGTFTPAATPGAASGVCRRTSTRPRARTRLPWPRGRRSCTRPRSRSRRVRCGRSCSSTPSPRCLPRSRRALETRRARSRSSPCSTRSSDPTNDSTERRCRRGQGDAPVERRTGDRGPRRAPHDAGEESRVVFAGSSPSAAIHWSKRWTCAGYRSTSAR